MKLNSLILGFLLAAGLPLASANAVELSAEAHLSRVQTVTVPMRGQIVGRSNQISVLDLKQAVINQYPELILSDATLLHVRVTGESLAPRASSSVVSLFINRQFQQAARLIKPSSNRTPTDSIVLSSSQQDPMHQPYGSWTLQFEDIARIQTIEAQIISGESEADRRGSIPRGAVRIGVGEAQKIVTRSEAFRANRQADRLYIRARDNEMELSKIEVTYANGRSVVLTMSSRLYPREVQGIYLRRFGRVVEVKVWARTTNLKGSRAEYAVWLY